MRELKDDVVVTGLVPYGDADLVVHLFAREAGRLGAFARGGQKSRRRFPGLGAPSLGRALLRERRAADLWDLVELDMEPVILGLAADPRALGHAAYLVELCERLLPEAEPSPEVFDLTVAAVRGVAATGASTARLRAFELQLLRHLGWLPDLYDLDGPSVAWDADGGRLLTRAAPGAVPFPEEARQAALALLGASLHELPDIEAGTLRSVSRLFAATLARHVQRPLKSVDFLRALGPFEVAGPEPGIAGREPSR